MKSPNHWERAARNARFVLVNYKEMGIPKGVHVQIAKYVLHNPLSEGDIILSPTMPTGLPSHYMYMYDEQYKCMAWASSDGFIYPACTVCHHACLYTNPQGSKSTAFYVCTRHGLWMGICYVCHTRGHEDLTNGVCDACNALMIDDTYTGYGGFENGRSYGKDRSSSIRLSHIGWKLFEPQLKERYTFYTTPFDASTVIWDWTNWQLNAHLLSLPPSECKRKVDSVMQARLARFNFAYKSSVE